MPLDFRKLKGGASADSVLEPREIFRALPGRGSKYTFPRDVQAEVWTRWFAGRERRDRVIKLNTGSGKTVVGLLVLKSCLNERVGPAVYVAPSPYLADQVIAEARSLGLAVDADPRSIAVTAGRAILVTTIKKLFNGLSQFGVGGEGEKIEIGSLAIDDAHACLQEAEEQFTLVAPNDSEAYEALFKLFEDSLRAQSNTRVDDLEAGEPNVLLPVPFWAWHDALPKAGKALRTLRDDPKAKFVWPLLKDVLAECRCVFGTAGAEISPRMLPVDMIPSFTSAHRRVFMGATFKDDGVLVSHFDVEQSALKEVVTPDSANDIGDRMILVPQALVPDLTDDDLKEYLVGKADSHNVVVLVPSNYRAKFWADVAAQTLVADNLADGIAKLRAGHVGLTVIVNRYDGIDLPYDACRVLAVDGLPDVRRLTDKVEHGVRHAVGLMSAEAVQRIEQGMGRGNRAADDWCVVLLMGRSLTAHVYAAGARDRFTTATRAQWDLSEEVAAQLHGRSIDELDEAVESCLSRNPDWIKASRGVLVGLKYPAGSAADPITVARRHAFNAARAGDLAKAIEHSRTATNSVSDARTKGWLLAEQAAYQHRVDPTAAQVTLRSAKAFNNQVPTPLLGVTYNRLSADLTNQAARCLEALRESYATGNELVVTVHAICDDLRFEPETSERFEQAFSALGHLIGFETQRPEADYGRGPDILWKMGTLLFAVVEAKNGATTNRISKGDANQLAGSINWFTTEYDRTCKGMPVMIHPSRSVAGDASVPAAARVMTTERLSGLVASVRQFAAALASKPRFGNAHEVGRLLADGGLSADTFVNRHTVVMR